MGVFAKTFKTIVKTKQMGGDFAPRLPLGQHKLSLTKCKMKTSARDENELIFEVEFLVLDSSIKKIIGTIAGWSWWPTAKNESKNYQANRILEFLETTLKSFTTDDDINALMSLMQEITPDADFNEEGTLEQVFGELMQDESQPLTGLEVHANVFEKPNKKDPSKPYENVRWSTVEQTLADVEKASSKAIEVREKVEAERAATPAADHGNAPGQRADASQGKVERQPGKAAEQPEPKTGTAAAAFRARFANKGK